MNRLSDKLRHIGDSWAIGDGRYVGAGPINQSLVSTTGGAPWAIGAEPNFWHFSTPPMSANFQRLANFIWAVADLLRGPYRPPQYERVMLH